MRNMKKSLTGWLLLLTMMVGLFASVLSVHAAGTTTTGMGGQPYDDLIQTLVTGEYTYISNNKQYSFGANRYSMQGGGYVLYCNLWADFSQVAGSITTGADLFNDDFERLKPGEKQKFIKDIFTLANAVANDTQNGYRTDSNAPTDDTVNDLMTVLQGQSGMGSTMLATLLQNTKPDYVSANRLYEPFSGVVGTILGVVSVLIMAALGVTMALDLAYITIPAFQMALGGTNEGGHGDKSKGIGGIISQEAKKAVQAADGGSGGQAGSGEYKAAVGIYFKYRWKGLVLLGICLLYLVQGQIYTFVGWFIDLFSGFLGF